MASAHLGGEDVLAHSGADAADLVGRNAHADAGAADEQTAFHFAFADALGDFVREVGVIDAFRPFRADVEHLVPHRPDQGKQAPLDLHAAVIAANDDVHIYTVSVPLGESQGFAAFNLGLEDHSGFQKLR